MLLIWFKTHKIDPVTWNLKWNVFFLNICTFLCFKPFKHSLNCVNNQLKPQTNQNQLIYPLRPNLCWSPEYSVKVQFICLLIMKKWSKVFYDRVRKDLRGFLLHCGCLVYYLLRFKRLNCADKKHPCTFSNIHPEKLNFSNDYVITDFHLWKDNI